MLPDAGTLLISVEAASDPGFLATALSVVAMSSVLAFAVRHVREAGGDRTLYWLAATVTTMLLYSVGHLLKLAVQSEPTTLLLHQLYHGPLLALPVVFFCAALVYTGRGGYVDRRTVALLLTPAAIGFVLVMTNFRYHTFVWTEYVFVESGALTTVDPRFGPVVYLYLAYGYGLVLSGLYYFLELVRQEGSLYRGQGVAISLAVVPPVGLSLLYYGEIAFARDHTTSGFLFTVFLLGWAIYRYRLLDVVPVARNSVIESMRDPYLVVDGDGKVVDCNPAAAELVGERDPVGFTLKDLMPDLVEHEGGAGTSDEVEDGELQAGDRYFSVSRNPIGTRATSGEGTLLMLRDITRRKRNEQKLQRANRRLEKFASVVSHDLRNPLTVAKNYAEHADEDPDAVAKVRDAHERMEEIIEDVLAITRKAELELRPVELEDAAEEAWGNVDTGDAALEVDSSLVLEADREKLLQALENLYRNSVEHGGGDVEVSVGATENGFYVADDGRGFFDPSQVFGGEDAPGLGLWIVQEIADLHGWHVSAENDDGARVEFEV